MREEPGAGEIDGSEREPARGRRRHGEEGGVGDAGAEGEVEVGYVGVAGEDRGEMFGTEGRQGSAVAGLDGVKGFGDQREGFFVEWVWVKVVEDCEDELFG